LPVAVRRLRLVGVALGLLVTAGALAQTVGPPASFPLQAQAEDGSWPAPPAAAGVAPRHVAVTACALLCTLAQAPGPGSTTAAAKATAWLRQQLDARGCCTRGDGAEARFDHALATFALAEASVDDLRHDIGLQGDLCRAVDGLLCANARAGAPAPEHAALCALVAFVLRQAGRPMAGRAARLDSWLRATTPLAARSPSGRAALVLMHTLRDEPLPCQAELDALWPADPVAEPFATLYLALAQWQAGGRAWTAVRLRVLSLRDAQHRGANDSEYGTWVRAARRAKHSAAPGSARSSPRR
jgi:hypothetical protein